MNFPHLNYAADSSWMLLQTKLCSNKEVKGLPQSSFLINIIIDFFVVFFIFLQKNVTRYRSNDVNEEPSFRNSECGN